MSEELFIAASFSMNHININLTVNLHIAKRAAQTYLIKLRKMLSYFARYSFILKISASITDAGYGLGQDHGAEDGKTRVKGVDRDMRALVQRCSS